MQQVTMSITHKIKRIVGFCRVFSRWGRSHKASTSQLSWLGSFIVHLLCFGFRWVCPYFPDDFEQVIASLTNTFFVPFIRIL